MQTLVELCHLQYDFIELYYQKIAYITALAANKDESAVGLQGIEFWTTLTEVEIEREKKGQATKQYIRNSSADLISLML